MVVSCERFRMFHKEKGLAVRPRGDASRDSVKSRGRLDCGIRPRCPRMATGWLRNPVMSLLWVRSRQRCVANADDVFDQALCGSSV